MTDYVGYELWILLYVNYESFLKNYLCVFINYLLTTFVRIFNGSIEVSDHGNVACY